MTTAGTRASEKPTTALADTQVQQHTSIRRVLGQVAKVTEPAELAPLVDKLAGLLPEHFAHETAEDGVFETVLRRDPGAGRAIDRFIAEHKTFMADLVALQSALDSGEDDALARARALGQALARHEAEENDVLFDALYIDTPAGD